MHCGKKGMDVVGHGCVRGENGGDLLLFVFLDEKKEKKKKNLGFSLFKYEEFKSVKWIKSLRITFSG